MSIDEGELKGVEQLRATMKLFPDKIVRKWMIKALRAAAAIVQKQMIADAPVRSGLTQSMIKVRPGKRSRKGISVNVVLSGIGINAGKAFYAAFVNYGWKWGARRASLKRNYRETDVGRQRNRVIPGTRWINKAFNKSEDAAQKAIVDTLTEGLKTEAAAAPK